MTEPSRELVSKYWDEQPCDSEGLGFPEGSLEFFEEMEERRYSYQSFIHSFAQFTRWRGKKVLEVGCGCGTDFLQFTRAGAETYAVDLSRHSVELAKKRLKLYGLKAEVRQRDSEGLPFPDNYFDLIYSWGVLHHSPHPEIDVAEIYRVLKPGGCLKVMVYYRNSPYWLYLWLKYALLKGRIFTSLSRLISERQESPGTRALTMKEIKRLFHQFSPLKFHPAPCLEISFLKKHRAVSWLANLYPHKLAAWMALDGQKPNEVKLEEIG